MVAGYLRSSLNAASGRSLTIRLVGVASPSSRNCYYRISTILNHQTAGFSSCAVYSHPSSQQQKQHGKKKKKKPFVPREGSATPAFLQLRSNDNVNPPTSTLPAPLTLPETPAKFNFSYLLALGRAYASFYKTGAKNIWYNLKEARALAARVVAGALWIQNMDRKLAPPIESSQLLRTSGSAKDRLIVDERAVRKRRSDFHAFVSRMDRCDFQLLRRSSSDTRRMIPFALVLLVFEEFTPLIVATGRVRPPATCMLPAHAEKVRKTRAEIKEKLLAETEDPNIQALFNTLGGPPDIGRVLEGASLDRDVSRAATVVGARPLPAFPGIADSNIVVSMRALYWRASLYAHFAYIAIDDALIIRAGGVKPMTAPEVRKAVDERGGVEIGAGLEPKMAEMHQRLWLEQWITASRTMLIEQYG